MSIHRENLPVPPGDDRSETIEQIAAEIEDEIRHGHVPEDVGHLLEERLDAAGVELPPDAVEDLAEAIENDVSL